MSIIVFEVNVSFWLYMVTEKKEPESLILPLVVELVDGIILERRLVSNGVFN
ncbi:hypothetical protein OIU74_013359 [Salix koriyanagi]|uniref:Uncharacterized protein n=1 Tax=Salix koriyanagi TaxID=2511006 RepID=A0A9Q0T6D2_9ROSI|nr:hypothetical protein OIU74_013359 [Salix koriyanagi]